MIVKKREMFIALQVCVFSSSKISCYAQLKNIFVFVLKSSPSQRRAIANFVHVPKHFTDKLNKNWNMIGVAV